MFNFRLINEQITGFHLGTDESDLFFATDDGILNATINTRGGSDLVIGNSTQSGGSGIGILGTSITSQDGLTVVGNGSSIGIASSSITGGDGVDNITATGSLFGIVAVSISGAGGDDVFDLQSGVGTVDGGADTDTLILEGGESDYTFTSESGSTNSGNISGTDGTDIDVENIEVFFLDGEEFTFDELFGSGENSGEDISEAQLSGPFVGTDEDDSYEATTDGIVDAVFNTLGGNDTIIGNTDSDDGIAVAIQDTLINTGEGADTITATTRFINSIGMDNVTILAGADADTITVEQGVLLGVQDVFIDGGTGDDQFTLLSGTGTVNGGDDNDTLTLLFTSSEYTFTGANGSGNILGSSINTNVTDLDVTGIENFQFSDGTFTFDELFNQGDNVIDSTLTGSFVGTSQDDTYVATTGSIVGASFNTIAGNDTILGINSNANGVGISATTISSGDGNDIITGLATGTSAAIGMQTVIIQAGSGDDLITAQGTSLGVENVVIDGGTGDDIFNLGSGTGTIIGGGSGDEDTDTLILDSISTDYTFIGYTSDLGTIVNADLGTNLTVFNVDQFTFEDGTFAFDELFV